MKEEEFARAVALGLFDYLRKSRSHGFVVSLSGGADSSAVACLVAMMVRAGRRRTGRRAASARRLGLHPALRRAADTTATVCVACCTASTRPRATAATTTRNAARAVAEALGAEMSCLEIDDLVEGYVAGVEEVLGRKLTWETRRPRPAEHPGPRARARACGCWPTSRTPCCWPPATAPRRPSATPRWTATPAAA